MHHVLPTLLAASNVAGFALFGAFVAALVVLGVVTISWAVRRDRAGRRQMLEEQEDSSWEATPREGP